MIINSLFILFTPEHCVHVSGGIAKSRTEFDFCPKLRRHICYIHAGYAAKSTDTLRFRTGNTRSYNCLWTSESFLSSTRLLGTVYLIVIVYILTKPLICPCSLFQVEHGVCCLMEVMKESAQHHSKSWYLLRARALQTASEYLSLDTQALDSQLRQSIIQHGQLSSDKHITHFGTTNGKVISHV